MERNRVEVGLREKNQGIRPLSSEKVVPEQDNRVLDDQNNHQKNKEKNCKEGNKSVRVETIESKQNEEK